jgi:hypothetical protein
VVAGRIAQHQADFGIGKGLGPQPSLFDSGAFAENYRAIRADLVRMQPDVTPEREFGRGSIDLGFDL